MVDVRRALPAAPAGLSCGALATALVPPGRGIRPEVTVAAGLGVAVAAGIGLYREMAGWPERSRRRLGYAAASAVALVVAAGFLFAAFGTSLCGLWGEQCSDAELARAGRTWRWPRPASPGSSAPTRSSISPPDPAADHR